MNTRQSWLLENADALLKIITAGIDKQKIGLIREVVDDFRDEALSVGSSFFAPQACAELDLKSRLGWQQFVYTHDTPIGYEDTKKFRKQHYKLEDVLLGARHPRRVARLWDETHSFLEQRYKRTFADREDFVAMHAQYASLCEFMETLGELDEARREVSVLREAHAAEPDTGWDVAAALWEKYRLNICYFKTGAI
jgi:hypothetical protein